MAVQTIIPSGSKANDNPQNGAKSKTPFTDQLRKENPGVEITGRETFGELM